jgi:hypothetical protein
MTLKINKSIYFNDFTKINHHKSKITNQYSTQSHLTVRINDL